VGRDSRELPDFAREVLEVRDLGDTTIAALRVRGRGATGDAPFESALWHVSQWSHGTCSWWRVYHDEREARAAAGLSE
jgi:hypothetical protein